MLITDAFIKINTNADQNYVRGEPGTMSNKKGKSREARPGNKIQNKNNKAQGSSFRLQVRKITRYNWRTHCLCLKRKTDRQTKPQRVNSLQEFKTRQVTRRKSNEKQESTKRVLESRGTG